jgi:hypothetical protein
MFKFWKSKKEKVPGIPNAVPVRVVPGQQFPTIELGSKELRDLIVDGMILNAKYGGLVLGNMHSHGGIQIIRQSTLEHVQVIAEMEGWEYILNPFATEKYAKRLTEINAEFASTRNVFSPYRIGVEISMLDAKPRNIQGKEVSKILLIGDESQFIINKFSTSKHLEELNELNQHWQ